MGRREYVYSRIEVRRPVAERGSLYAKLRVPYSLLNLCALVYFFL